jgi:N-acetylglucosaminyldiphosphoundecaprenol N-acetyl-beta-D-mannosaminyltransferase
LSKIYFEHTSLLGVRIDLINVEELIQYLLIMIHCQRKAIISNVNVHAINIAYEIRWFKDFINHSQVVFCDGAGVILGARLLGYHIPERITYAEWVWRLAEFISNNHFSVYFLGGKPGIADKAAHNLQVRYPSLNIAGVQHGYFDKIPGSIDNNSVLDAIGKAAPDILIVGFGMPLQEQWLRENWNSLNVKIGLTGGAVFDYVSGELHRAPRWMTDNGLEWLGRMLIEPERLWRRYIIGNPLFLWRLFIHHILGFSLPNN